MPVNNLSELSAAIRSYVEGRAELELVEPEQTREIAHDVADRYVLNRETLWWWDSLKDSPVVINYGPNDGLNTLCRLLIPSRSDSLVLVVTDDEHEPWYGIKGPLNLLIHLLREHWSFEYFITDESRSWVVFDTHSNTLVLTGSILDKP